MPINSVVGQSATAAMWRLPDHASADQTDSSSLGHAHRMKHSELISFGESIILGLKPIWSRMSDCRFHAGSDLGQLKSVFDQPKHASLGDIDDFLSGPSAPADPKT